MQGSLKVSEDSASTRLARKELLSRKKKITGGGGAKKREKEGNAVKERGAYGPLHKIPKKNYFQCKSPTVRAGRYHHGKVVTRKRERKKRKNKFSSTDRVTCERSPPSKTPNLYISHVGTDVRVKRKKGSKMRPAVFTALPEKSRQGAT